MSPALAPRGIGLPASPATRPCSASTSDRSATQAVIVGIRPEHICFVPAENWAGAPERQ